LLNVMEIIIERITEPTELQKFFMSDTPETDERATFRPNDDGMTDWVMAEFARELERVLIEANTKLQEFQENHNTIAMAIIRPVEEENARLREQILDLAKRMNGHGCSCSGCVDAELAANKYRDDILSNKKMTDGL